MVQDVVKELGYLTLGTRLKRVGERLQAQTQALLEQVQIDLPPSQLPLLAVLDRLGPLNIGELTEALGISQPGVTRLVDKLTADGLLSSAQSEGDRRVRTIALTRSGRQLLSRSKRVWPLIEAAVADACAPAGDSVAMPGDSILVLLAALEDALASAPLYLRAERLRLAGEADAPT